MKTKKYAIAISVYDKFEEVSILTDIIRENWKNDYIITVCCNHPDGAKHLKSLPIDAYVQGDNVPYDSSKPIGNLRYRAADTMRKSSTAAIELGSRAVMHLHSDAWPLSEGGFRNITEQMYEREAFVAGRGLGFGYKRQDCPCGHLDDMFFIFDADFAKSVDLFDIRPLCYMPHWQGIHGILSAVVMVKVRLDRFYLYDDHTSLILWPGKPKIMPFLRSLPVIYSESTGFLHVNRGSFPEDYGKYLQAFYLSKEGVIKGKHIEAFLNEWYREPEQVFSELDALEAKLDRKLRWLGFDPKKFGQQYTPKMRFLDNVTLNAVLKNLIVNRSSDFLKFIYRTVGKRIGWLNGSEPRNFWPEPISEFYKKYFNENDFAEASDNFWFTKKPTTGRKP